MMDQGSSVSDRLYQDMLRLRGSFSVKALVKREELLEPTAQASRELIDQVLFRLTRAKKIERISRGLYQVISPVTLTAEPAIPGYEDRRPAPVVAALCEIGELLRGDYKMPDVGNIVLALTVLRRLDCLLESTKGDVLAVAGRLTDLESLSLDETKQLREAARLPFYNTSPLTLKTVLAHSTQVRHNLEAYIGGFSPNVRDIFTPHISNLQFSDLHDKKLLIEIVTKLVSIDLHANTVSNEELGDAVDILFQRFAELSSETLGRTQAPPDAIKLAVSLLLAGDTGLQATAKPQRSVYDPVAGVGGMLSGAMDLIKARNGGADVRVFAQEPDSDSYAICKSVLLLKGQNPDNIAQANVLANDRFPGRTFDWMLSNPPYGMDWKDVKAAVDAECKRQGPHGRFAAGLPRIGDSQLLFLLALVSKMRTTERNETGSRIAIITNGLPLFSGGAGSGESDIRKHLFESDLIEALIGLPCDMFYGTGAATYIWLLTNKKAEERKGVVQLIDATSFSQAMPKNRFSKRRFMSEENIAEVIRIHNAFRDSNTSKIMSNDAFGYQAVVVERPLRRNFSITGDRLQRVSQDSFHTTVPLDVAKLKSVLVNMVAGETFKSRAAFVNVLEEALTRVGLTAKTSSIRALSEALAEPDQTADICRTTSGEPEPDSDLRDIHIVPLNEDIDVYLAREVTPYVDDAWVDHDKTKVGYDIQFTRFFHAHGATRQLAEINDDLKSVTHTIVTMIEDAIA